MTTQKNITRRLKNPADHQELKEHAAERLAETDDGMTFLNAMETWLENTQTSTDTRTITAILQLLMTSQMDDHQAALHAIRKTLAKKGR